jgi:hypothetical protein
VDSNVAKPQKARAADIKDITSNTGEPTVSLNPTCASTTMAEPMPNMAVKQAAVLANNSAL